MTARSIFWLVSSCFAAACSLFTSLDDLRGPDAAADAAAADAAADAAGDANDPVDSSEDASGADAGPEAAADATRSPCDGGIVLVQSKPVEGSSVALLTAAFSADNAAGDLLIAFVRMSSSTQTLQVSDSAGNLYTDAISQAQTADGHLVHIVYAKNVLGGPNTVTATFSASNAHPWLAIYEYSGLEKANPLDRVSGAQGTGTAPSSGPTPATASAAELVFAGLGLPNNYAGSAGIGSGFGLLQQDMGTSRANNEAMTTTATGTYAGTFTLSVDANWSAVVATFVGCQGI